MTVVVLVSSPRSGGFGDRMAQSVADGIASAGKEAKVHHLNDMVSFRQCQNCGACKENGGKCIIDDDIAPMIDDIRDCEGMVFVTSIAFNEVNGLFKMVQDRMYCFLDMNACTIMPKGKRVAVIVTAGADETSADRVARGLEKVMVEHFFCESVGRLAYTTWMMPAESPIDKEILEQLAEIGKRFGGA